ncbi:MAG TPA: periplasmic heavy metal sensor [Alphaproteobacteria bacterium]|nr:periplasmic heavy metal sensor [Alphaproteobacteria bacterium]
MSNGRTKAWALQIVLFASLAVNLFVAGFFAAHLLHRREPPGPSPMAVLERISAPLPEKDKEILAAAWKADQAKLAGLSAELQAARREVRAKLIAEPFDSAALAAAMTDARMKHEALDAEFQAIIVDAATKFSPEGRKLLWSRPPPR